jgi:hypothetical protein
VAVDPDRRSGFGSAVLPPTTRNGTQVAQDTSPCRTKGQATHHDGIYAVREIVVHEQEDGDHFCPYSGSQTSEENEMSG